MMVSRVINRSKSSRNSGSESPRAIVVVVIETISAKEVDALVTKILSLTKPCSGSPDLFFN